MRENFLYTRDRLWAWFVGRARGPHALFWLGVCAFLDPIFFPIAPELYLGVLILAHKDWWKHYLLVAVACSAAGAVAGYFVGALLFNQFGGPILEFFSLGAAFAAAKAQLESHVFATMLVVPFTIVPEKVFVLAAGFLQAPFWLFIVGFAVGRAARISIIVYLIHRFGSTILEVVGKYFLWFTALLLTLGTIYVMVRWYF